MWNAIITEAGNSSVLYQVNNLTLAELETWLNLQVPALRFANFKSQTIKNKGLRVELDHTYNVVVEKQGTDNKLTIQMVNTAPPEESEADEDEEPPSESVGLPNLQTLTTTEALKAIGEVVDKSALTALREQEKTGKNRVTVIAAIDVALKL